MSVIGYALLVLLILPLVEIALFVMLGGALGVVATLFVVIGSAVLGLFLLTQYSLGSLLRSPQEWLEALNEGEKALRIMLGAALLAVAGVLLLVPGFFTDALGIALLLPFVRGPLAGLILARLGQRWRAAKSAHPTIIEGEYKSEPPSSRRE